MKKLLLLLLVALATLTLASCSSATKAEEKKKEETALAEKRKAKDEAEKKLLDGFEALVDKSIELEGRISSGDDAKTATAEYEEVKKEIQTYLVDYKTSIEELSELSKVEFQLLMDKTQLGGGK